MKILIEDQLLVGSPTEIAEQMRDSSFSRESFDTLSEYLDYAANRFTELTDIPISLEHLRTDNEKARELFDVLDSVGAVEIVEADDE